MKYRYVLFDADDTLFSFDNKVGLKRMLSAYKFDFTDNDYEFYQITNKKLWFDYQNGTIAADHLKVARFAHLGETLGISAKQLDDEFLDAMSIICKPLPGAVSLLNKAKNKLKLGLVTNGFARLQHIRLQNHGLENIFDYMVISELVGVTKPHKAIFDHTFELMGNPCKYEVLMVGDSATNDILGGMNAGIDTCWLQHPGEIMPEEIHPTYTIGNLAELETLLEL